MRASRKHIPAVSMSDLVCHFDGTVQAYLGQKKSWMVLNLGMFNVIHVWCKKVALKLNASVYNNTILQEVRNFSHHNASFKHMSYLSSTMLPTWKIHQHPENPEAAPVLLQASFHCARPTCVKLFIEMKDVGSEDSLTKPHFGLTSAEVPLFGVVKKAKKQKTCFQPNFLVPLQTWTSQTILGGFNLSKTNTPFHLRLIGWGRHQNVLLYPVFLHAEWSSRKSNMWPMGTGSRKAAAGFLVCRMSRCKFLMDSNQSSSRKGMEVQLWFNQLTTYLLLTQQTRIHELVNSTMINTQYCNLKTQGFFLAKTKNYYQTWRYWSNLETHRLSRLSESWPLKNPVQAAATNLPWDHQPKVDLQDEVERPKIARPFGLPTKNVSLKGITNDNRKDVQ